MPIRVAINGDREFIDELDEKEFSKQNGVGARSAARAMDRPDSVALVYVDDHESQIGFAIVQWNEPTEGQSYLAKIAVVPEVRLKGTGKALLTECERRMRGAHGKHAMYLHVSEHNKTAQEFFKCSGYRFHPESRVRLYFDGRALLMAKEIG
jgi:ribosomal protein S18 acetylase RimI-like enzyme